ncbi:LysM peptidoglycan-binding domain-containing protein [Natranaerobius thermophilus]|uniref:Peptidoglycan-binding LysM n=1 Tax=Natranaerobius thermophilus (strain ATCC BAA-1301 / DSM 18059 / JW/NM-WN-LF) TaxID=457570 RepID=B2A788_NATTJ|nr:LysM domain-containing protein [Natranaerobius thermophilus]ACB84282.1 Peptidoglycan-binding LysM [Natranaerobius thermophilus JW/NM-WN-LF]
MSRKPYRCPRNSLRYTVQETDTIYDIAKHYDISLHELKKANRHIEDLEVICPGDVLCIPREIEPRRAKVIIALNIGTNKFGYTGKWEAALYKGAIPAEETEGRFTEWKQADKNIVTFELPEEVRKSFEVPFSIPEDTYVRIRTLGNDVFPVFDLVTEPFTLVRNKKIIVPINFISKATILPLANKN